MRLACLYLNMSFRRHGLLQRVTLETLLKPENKGTLTSILTYHVVPGKVTATQLVGKIKAGGGTAMLGLAS